MPKLLTGQYLAAGLAAGMIILAGMSGARADVEYPWCAIYSGGGASTNCGFTSLQQCLETVRGLPGTCNPNPAYPTSANRRRSAPRER